MSGPGDGPGDGPATATALERTQAELSAALEKLARSTEQLTVFAAQVSHDLRNPLTSVSMSLQMLAEQPSVLADDDAAWMVSRALSATHQMATMIEDLLNATKADSTGAQD